MPYPSLPFSKIFLFRIYVPTTYTHRPYLTLISTRPATGFHTSPRQSSIHKPIHQRHCPTHSTDSAPILPHKHTAIQPPQTHSPTNTPSTTTHRHTRRRPPPTQTLTPMTHPTLTHSQAGCSRSPLPVRNSTGRAQDQTRPSQTRPIRIRPYQTARNQIGQASDSPHTGSD